MSCIEEIYEDLVVGHALQMGHFCETPLPQLDLSQTTVMSAQEEQDDKKITGEYHYGDYYYECGYWNQILLLDEETQYPGDRPTCFNVQPLKRQNRVSYISTVGMSSDWRITEDGEGLDPLCYVFQEDVSATNNNATPTDVTVTNNETNAP